MTIPTTTQLRFSQTPSLWGSFFKVMLARRPKRAPEHTLNTRIEASLTGLRANPRQLADYSTQCALTPGAALPLIYPHLLAMPLHMAMLTHKTFPLALMGLVHVANRITSHQPIPTDATMELHCRIDGIQQTERGQSFEIETRVCRDGRTVWQEHSTFLAPSGQRARGAASAPDASARPEEPLARWAVAANAGRRYSRVTGDWNPIHVSGWTARLFGYPRAIAHGMWSLGRCAALLQQGGASTGPTVLEARFKRPLMLPGRVALYATSAAGPATHFRLAVEPTGEPHIEGRIETGPGVE